MSEKIPSGHSPRGRVEKADSNSSRESESSIHFDFDSYIPPKSINCEERIRPSSWDESDDDLIPENEGSSERTQLHLSESQKFKASVAAEINELKKQFFESLQKLKNSDYQPFDSATSMIEMKSEDRRQCPARVRRRTKSSSSLSPVLEAKSHSSSEKLSGLDEKFDEVSSKILDFDPKYYLNNFFNELRMKRISLINPPPVTDKPEEDTEWKNQDEDSNPPCNDQNGSDPTENDEHFCKTSRKLSQIIEVEESKRDLERSSEEMSENSYLFSKSLKKPEDNISPLQTARSRSEKISENFDKTKKQNFKSLSYEEFGDFQKVQKPFQGSLSERSSTFFRNKPRDNFSFLSVKSPKIASPRDDKNRKTPNKFVSFNNNNNNNQSETDFGQESTSKDDEKENLDSIDCLKIDLVKNFSENPTPRSSDRSDASRTNRTKSGKSKNSASPKFKVNVDRDSARSLRLEDVKTPDSLEKVPDIGIESEPKTVTFSDCSPKKSTRNLGSENSFEQKSDRTFQIPLHSPSLESVKSISNFSRDLKMNSSRSQKSKSTDRSQKGKDRSSMNSPCSGIEPTECYSLLESIRSYDMPPNSRVGSPLDENFKNLSQRSTKTAYQSSRSSKSDKSKTPNTAKEKFLNYPYDEETPTAELELPLDIPESQKSSYRSVKAEEKNSGRSEINNFKQISRRSSDRSSSLKSKNSECMKSPKITPKSNESISSRSKESFDNPNEADNPDFETNFWKDPDKVNDSLSNRTSARVSGRKSSWRNQKSQQNSPQRGTNTDDFGTEERYPASGKTTRRSVESTRNSSPKSIKFSPTSRTPEELQMTNVHPGMGKLYLEVSNPTVSNKTSSISEDEYVKESSQPVKSESESDRYSEKKLSIINEASIEDLEISNDSIENEENGKDQSQTSSRSQSREFLPQNVNRSSKTTARSRKQTPTNEQTQEQSNLADGEKWNELIEAFGDSPNSSFILEKTFSAFLRKSENNWDSVKENAYSKSEGKENQKTSPRMSKNKYEIPGRYFAYENEVEDREEDSRNSNLDYEENSLEKPIKKDIGPLQNFQNLYYFNVNERKPFGIGECGDVTNWNADKSDTPERPKAYGDGMQLNKTSEVLTIIGKREKEIKTQRQLWTDLKGDFRNSKKTIQKLFTELEDQTYSKNVISAELKTSKSDNYISNKKSGGDNAQILPSCELKNKSRSHFETNVESIPEKNTAEHDISVESLEYEKEELENIEFECKTPRLSKSMINLDIQLEEESFEDVELNTNFNSSGSQLFERASAVSKKEKESTNLNIFLARNQKEEKTAAKSNTWLNFKSLETDNSNKKEKKIKKRRKDETPKEYLSTRKSRSSVPPLKLRNPNCFQNFYKRIVSVFCLTSHSSAATSK